MASLFYDDEFQALRAVIEGHPKSYKACASYLWPDMKPESAYAKLKACTNPNGDQRLTSSQCVALSNFTGLDDWVCWVNDEAGYERPKRRPVADQKAELMREFISTGEQMKAIAERLERLGGPL